MSRAAGSVGGQQRPPPPPIPRRHPSRPSIGAATTTSSGSSTPSSPSSLDHSSSSFNTYAHLLASNANPTSPPSQAPSPLYDPTFNPARPSVKVSLAESSPQLSASPPHYSSSNGDNYTYASNGDYFDHQQASLHHGRPEPVSHIVSGFSVEGAGGGSTRSGPRTPGPGRPGSPNAPPVSPGIQNRLGPASLGLGTVGLGPVRIDFKDWVKAGREAREGSISSTAGDDDDNTTPASRRLSKRFSLDSHRFVDFNDREDTNGDAQMVTPASARNLNGSRSVHSPSRSSTEPRPLSYAHLDSSLPSSNSMSSLSVDSHRSPQGLLARRASSRASERVISASEALRSSTSTPRRTSHELVRDFNSLSLSGNGSSRSSHRMSMPLSPGSVAAAPSPSRLSNPPTALNQLDHRFSRRMMTRTDSSSGLVDRVDEEHDEEVETMVSHEHHEQNRRPKTLEERLREADDRLPSRMSQRLADAASTPQRNRFDSVRRNPRGSEVRASPPQNGVSTPTATDSSDPPSAGKPGSSGGRVGKVRQPIPLEFQNGRLFTPSPKPEAAAGNIDLNQSPVPARERERSRERPRDTDQDYNLASPRSQRSYATARPHSVLGTGNRDSPLRGWTGRSSNVGSHVGSHGGSPHVRPESRNDFDRFTQPVGRRREFPTTRARPESALETVADRDRYDNGPYTPSRMRFSNDSERAARLSALIGDRGDSGVRSSGDFTSRLRDLGAHDGSGRTPITPNDSVSAVGSRVDSGGSGRKDPMDIVRRLEETRAQSNRRWEEDRSMSVLGDRSPSTMGGDRSRYGGEREVLARPSSRLDDSNARSSSRMSTASRIRPSTSLASVSTNRESYMYQGGGTPRTQPMARRRTTSTDDASIVESPLLGRTSRLSGSFAGSLEPRVVRRSQTSFEERSVGSSNDAGLATDHGRNLVDAARVLDRKLEFDPEIVTKLTVAASTGERANTGVRAAAAIAAQLAIDIALDDTTALTTVRERLPRLAVTLREAGRSSDQAVRDLTDALLAIRGMAGTSSTRATPQRTRPETHYVPREPGSEPLHRRGWSTTATLDTPLSRHSQLHSPSVYSPSARFSTGTGRETPRSAAPPLSARERYDSGASASSSRNEQSSTTSSRMEGPRLLDPIEQSPPARPESRSSPAQVPATTRAAAAAMAMGVGAPPPPPRTERSASRSQPPPPQTPQPHNSPAQGAVEHWAHTQGVHAPGVSPVHVQQTPSGPTSATEPTEPGLRKQSSIASTHTVRPYSFVPSHAPEPTTALSNSPAYSQPSMPHSKAQVSTENLPARSPSSTTPPRVQGHAKRDSTASNASSVYSRNGDPLSPTATTGPVEVQRMGTFGAAEGARVRASVSERFRKHLTGEHA